MVGIIYMLRSVAAHFCSYLYRQYHSSSSFSVAHNTTTVVLYSLGTQQCCCGVVCVVLHVSAATVVLKVPAMHVVYRQYYY